MRVVFAPEREIDASGTYAIGIRGLPSGPVELHVNVRLSDPPSEVNSR